MFATTEIVSYDDAVAMLPNGRKIHTVMPTQFGQFGADMKRKDILTALKQTPQIFKAGPNTFGHGLAAKHQNRWILIQTIAK